MSQCVRTLLAAFSLDTTAVFRLVSGYLDKDFYSGSGSYESLWVSESHRATTNVLEAGDLLFKHRSPFYTSETTDPEDPFLVIKKKYGGKSVMVLSVNIYHTLSKMYIYSMVQSFI